MAHSLPTSDTFADDPINNNGGPRWTDPALWLPVDLWTNASSYINYYPEFGVLHNANGGATGYGENTPVYNNPYWQAHVFRDAPTQDVSVRALFRMNFFDSTWEDVDSYHHAIGVMARTTGAANTLLLGSAPLGFDEGVQGPTFYAFFRRRYVNGNRYHLLKVVRSGASSTITELADAISNDYPWDSGRAAHGRGQTAGLRMDITTVTGTAVFNCYLILSTGDEVLVLQHTDSSSPIVETGLAGFIMPSELVTFTGKKWSWSCMECEVTDGTTSLMIEGWERAQITSARTITPRTGYGSAGYCLNGKYTGDQFGSTAWRSRIARGATEILEVDTLGGMHIMYDPASSSYTQARRLTFQYVSGAGSDRTVGVLLRMSLGTTARHEDLSGAGKNGYGLILNVDSAGTTFTASLYRWSGGTATVMATRECNQSGDTFTASIGSYIDLDLAVANVNGGSDAEGNVHLEPVFDGVKLTDWQDLADGVIENSDGSLTDQASSRVLSGAGQGFFAQDNDGSNDIQIDDWDQLPVTIDPGTGDQSSIAFGFEKTGATETLTVPMEWPVEETTEDYTSAKRMEVGYTQAVPQAALQRRRWRTGSQAATAQEAADILSFFRTIGGWDKPFFWVTDGGETVTAYVDSDRLKVVKIDKGTWTFDMTIVEAIGPTP